MADTPLPLPRGMRHFAATDAIDALVTQAADLLNEAWYAAIRTCPGHNIGLLNEAYDACMQWLQEGE